MIASAPGLAPATPAACSAAPRGARSEPARRGRARAAGRLGALKLQRGPSLFGELSAMFGSPGAKPAAEPPLSGQPVDRRRAGLRPKIRAPPRAPAARAMRRLPPPPPARRRDQRAGGRGAPPTGARAGRAGLTLDVGALGSALEAEQQAEGGHRPSSLWKNELDALVPPRPARAPPRRCCCCWQWCGGGSPCTEGGARSRADSDARGARAAVAGGGGRAARVGGDLERCQRRAPRLGEVVARLEPPHFPPPGTSAPTPTLHCLPPPLWGRAGARGGARGRAGARGLTRRAGQMIIIL